MRKNNKRTEQKTPKQTDYGATMPSIPREVSFFEADPPKALARPRAFQREAYAAKILR